VIEGMVRRFSIAALVGIAVGPGSAVWVPDAMAQSSPKSVQELMQGINAPTTPEELFANIVSGIERRIFLRADFFAEESIRRILGDQALKFDWVTNHAKEKYVFMNPIPSGTAQPRRGCMTWGLLSWRTLKPPLAVAHIALTNNYADPGCASFSIDLVQRFLGEPTHVASVFPPGRPPNPHRIIVPMQTVHPLGNTDVEYLHFENSVERTFRLVVIGNGVIQSMNIRLLER
jgi:hypothetical protein